MSDPPAGDSERQPLQKDDVDSVPPKVVETMLVNNELYDVPQTVVERAKQIPPPLTLGNGGWG